MAQYHHVLGPGLGTWTKEMKQTWSLSSQSFQTSKDCKTNSHITVPYVKKHVSTLTSASPPSQNCYTLSACSQFGSQSDPIKACISLDMPLLRSPQRSPNSFRVKTKSCHDSKDLPPPSIEDLVSFFLLPLPTEPPSRATPASLIFFHRPCRAWPVSRCPLCCSSGR